MNRPSVTSLSSKLPAGQLDSLSYYTGIHGCAVGIVLVMLGHTKTLNVPSEEFCHKKILSLLFHGFAVNSCACTSKHIESNLWHFPGTREWKEDLSRAQLSPLHYIVASFWGETEVSLTEREPFGWLARLQWATKLIYICGVVSGWGKLRKTAQPFRDGLLPDCCLCDQTTPHIIASRSVSPVPLQASCV